MGIRQICNTVQAKANLNKYLDQVSKGEEVIIRRRGRAIAKIIPLFDENFDEHQMTQEFVARLKKFHQRVSRSRGIKSYTIDFLRELREES